MSFGRAGRPSSPRYESVAERKAFAAAAAAASKIRDAEEASIASEIHANETWSRKMFSRPSAHLAPTKWTPRTDSATITQLATARTAATFTPSPVLALDRSYSKVHNTPFNSLKQVRTASWEAPLLNPEIPLKRLALVERPDLIADNNAHASQKDAEAHAEEDFKMNQSFFFRENQLARLHARKAERIELEARSSLRRSLDELNANVGANPALHPPPNYVSQIDEPQFIPIATENTTREDWNAAHHLTKSLTTDPYVPPLHLKLVAIESMERKIQQEYERELTKRQEKEAKIGAIAESDRQLHERNRKHARALNDEFAHRERRPQNLDAHLQYLSSKRCAPRPPSAKPTTIQTYRAVDPHKSDVLAHIAHSGWTSLRSKLTFPMNPIEIGPSGAITVKAPSPHFTRDATSRPVSRFAQTSRPLSSAHSARSHTASSSLSARSSHHPTSQNTQHPGFETHRDKQRAPNCGLTQFSDTLTRERGKEEESAWQAEAESELAATVKRSESLPVVQDDSAEQSEEVSAPRLHFQDMPSGYTSLVQSVRGSTAPSPRAAFSTAIGGSVHWSALASPVNHHTASVASSPTNLTHMDSGVMNVPSEIAQQQPSPRAFSFLTQSQQEDQKKQEQSATLIQSIQAHSKKKGSRDITVPISPRLSQLSQPLARLANESVKPLDHSHRDFRGLVPPQPHPRSLQYAQFLKEHTRLKEAMAESSGIELRGDGVAMEEKEEHVPYNPPMHALASTGEFHPVSALDTRPNVGFTRLQMVATNGVPPIPLAMSPRAAQRDLEAVAASRVNSPRPATAGTHSHYHHHVRVDTSTTPSASAGALYASDSTTAVAGSPLNTNRSLGSVPSSGRSTPKPPSSRPSTAGLVFHRSTHNLPMYNRTNRLTNAITHV